MKNNDFSYIMVLSLLISILFSYCNSEPPLEPERPDISAYKYIVLQYGTLIDGSGSEPILNEIVIIKDSLIIYAGPNASAIIPDSSFIIDASSKTILPGFFNVHTHNTNDTTSLKTWLNEGVTTVRDLAIPTSERILMKQILKDKPSCYFPRMIYSSPIFNIPDGVPHGSYGVVVSSVADASVKTNQQIDLGADLIKVYLDERDGYQSMPLEFLEAIVETAHSRNKKVVVHAQEAHLYERAIDAGVDEIVHPMLYEMTSDALVERLVADDVGVNSTLEIYKSPPMRQQAMRNIHKLHQNGVKIALGSDYELRWSMELGMPITEIELLNQAGLSPMEVIVTATKNAAHFCELEDKLGTIEPGKIADIILVEGNPLLNLRVLKNNLYMVIHHGIIITSL